MKIKSADIIKRLNLLADKEKAEVLQRFFKTGKGEYGEGDKFFGIVVPLQRALVKEYKELELSEIEKLLASEYHECRLTALLFLVAMFNKSKEESRRKQIYDFYIAHADRINNWDLVDLTSRDIVGGYLFDKSRAPLYKLVRSKNLWVQRISIISTYYFIKRDDFDDTFKLSTQLINHKHDLIHKASGWMLREVGKQNFDALYNYLVDEKLYTQMPRTMLRYAIEKFPEPLRKKFLEGKV